MKTRTIKNHITAKKVDMWWILLDQALPVSNIESVDPFLLIHHLKETYLWWQKSKHLWVGPHPHRGFSPVSFMYKWENEHRDSRWNRAIIWPWGTQWMNTWMGITHSERPSEKMAESWWEYELIQIWINSPAKNKMDQPYYHPLSSEETPLYSKQDWVEIAVVAWEYKWIISPIKTNSPLRILRITIKSWTSQDIEIPENYNCLLYTLDDWLIVDWKNIWEKDMIEFSNNGDNIHVSATQEVRFIILSGKAIWEKVDQYWPFVMNTRTQILQAMWDYQQGKMGVLIEEFE
jgi:redox-sensitive bicupin YhaK (pirin superfamily)